jgi:type IV secretion system protein TrbL
MVSPTRNASLKDQFYSYLTVQFDLFARVLEQFDNLSLFDKIMKFFPTLFIFVITGFIMLVASIFTMIAGLLIFIVLNITLAVGPILIPWMILQPTSHFFEGWLNYLVSSALALVVLAIMTGIGFHAMDAVYANFLVNGSQAFLPAALGGATVSALVAFLVGQSSDIAKDLTSGGKLSIGRLAGGIGQRANGVGAGAVNKGVGAGVSAAGSTLKSANLQGMGKRISGGDLYKSSGTRSAAKKAPAADTTQTPAT